MKLKWLSFPFLLAALVAFGVATRPKAAEPTPPSGSKFYYSAPGSDLLVPFALKNDPAKGAPKDGKDTKFKRGGKRSPGHKLAAAPKFHITGQPPSKFAMIPADLEMYGNDQYGDCVSAQTAVSLCAWTTYCGTPVKPTDAEVIAFARKYGLLNGADLTQVMDIMSSKGMTVGGKIYKEGGYSSVDYSVPLAFQSALCTGPVNVAIDADALPSGAGNKQGWNALGSFPKGGFPNTDHCITFLGYGSVSECYSYLGMAVPAGVDGTQQAYICDTWKTLGVVNQSWVMSTMEEAWVRNPTTVGFSPPTPNPTPTPTPTPNPTPTPTPPPTPVTDGYTGKIVRIQEYDKGVPQGSEKLYLGVPATAIEDYLKTAGFNPAVIADILKLVVDMRTQPRDWGAILADALKLATDLGLMKVEAEKTAPAPKPVPEKPSVRWIPEFRLARQRQPPRSVALV